MEWLPINGYEGIYEVSNYGKVRVLDRAIPIPNGATRFQEPRELVSDVNEKGYPRVSLSTDGKTVKFLIHILVAKTFIGNPNNYPEVNHIDGNKMNSIVTNLEWCTKEYNIHHSIEIGLKTGFTKEQIEYLKSLFNAGANPKDLATEFNKSRQTLSDIKLGRHRNLNPEQPTKYTGLPLWEHVSVSIAFPEKKIPLRCPSWEEMCYIKSLFWDEVDCVLQYHPSKDQYVNRHPYVLHLWRPIGQVIPIPDKSMVG
jgi:hypothetical protein